jgi:hypothetical protein
MEPLSWNLGGGRGISPNPLDKTGDGLRRNQSKMRCLACLISGRDEEERCKEKC